MNLFQRFLPIFLAACWVTGCDAPGDKPAHRHARADSAVGSGAELRPDLFSAAPETVEGCVGLYTYDSLNISFDSLDVDKGKKLLATKSGSFAYLRLHGKSMILHFDSTQSAKTGEKGFREVYRDGDYTVVLVLRTLEEEGEAVKEAGTMEIIHGGKHYVIRVKGLSGC